jgi:hypothetical protein
VNGSPLKSVLILEKETPPKSTVKHLGIYSIDLTCVSQDI